MQDTAVLGVFGGANAKSEVVPRLHEHCQRHDAVCRLFCDDILALDANEIALSIRRDDREDYVSDLGLR